MAVRGPHAGAGRWSAMPVVSGAAVAVTAALATVDRHQLGSTTSFVPAVLSVVACFDVLSVYLLVGEYRDTGHPRTLAMAAAYGWSLVLMAGYALAFPGVVSATPPLAVTPSTAPWLYLGWHVGFPVLLGAAWAPWPPRLTTVSAPHRRLSTAWTAIAAVAAAAAATVAGVVGFAHHLPVIIHGHDTLRMAQLTAPVTLPLVLLALAAAFTGTRHQRGPQQWTVVAVLVCLCDLVLTYTSRYRFSVGWYTGRALTLVAAATVLFAMLAQFRTLKARAEFHAAYDALTGLANRRATHDALDRLWAAAARGSRPLGVVLLDLDLFKQVNDRHGHDAGDQLLTAVGAALAGAVRTGDLVGRVGGEEFLALLPDTDLPGAAVVAERLRAAVAALHVPAAGGPATASAGVAGLTRSDHTPGDLLRRADHALYQAKAAGRDRVAVAAEPGRPEPVTPPAPQPDRSVLSSS